ncbi:MAG: tRNA epoxyqueuosine(34) reductase QueG [Pseudomonadota bacterium]
MKIRNLSNALLDSHLRGNDNNCLRKKANLKNDSDYLNKKTNLKTQGYNFSTLTQAIKSYAEQLGFQQLGISDTNLELAEKRLQNWLSKQFHGSMDYMQKHGTKRTRPAELIPGTIRLISVRMDYLPAEANIKQTLKNKLKAYISRYALGRDYHKVLKKRLEKLAQFIRQQVPELNYRVFTDSAPVMEKAIAEKAGIGWIGKSTNLINSKAGSWFFLGTIYTNIPLPLNTPAENHCGSCQACIDICPTQAIVGPYQLDARKCISYLTIENKGPIPTELRPLMGNRIYGCDDCQIICPWNKFAKSSGEADFKPRHGLKNSELIDLFLWNEATFEEKTRGSAIRRIGYQAWIRNIAVALGNAPYDEEIIRVLKQKRPAISPMVQEHIDWALIRQGKSRLS